MRHSPHKETLLISYAKPKKSHGQMNQRKFPTPSQFYRHQRPEYFSDSKIVSQAVLPREQLDYEISQISVNQKHDNFETLCRRLAEKLISPNLIPQVGPTGGGDGKTDSETYPVSNFISDRWYISDNKWNENENWAFAISAKTDWKPKIKSDVKKIIETNRGYTKIYFFSNQKISSKNKKEIQDQTKLDYNVELIVLDAEWILEKVYSNRLINEVIESLNLSRVYLEEKVIGARDSERISELEELESQINSTNRFFEIDFQLVEDCLESAVLSRMLELPRAEIIGKFERVLKFANKLKNIQIKIRVHYQLAWTLINWYDDYEMFYNEFLIVKQMVQEEPNINNIEYYLNLSNILQTISNVEEAKNILVIDYEKEDQEFVSFIFICSQNEHRPSTSLLSKFYLSFFQIRKNIKNEELISDELVKLKDYFEISKKHLDIPFEQLKEFTDIFGNLLPNNKEYDDLIDSIAEIEATRISELTAGQTYLNRGITKLKNNYTKESLVYFGKASRKLAKDETQYEFYICLMLISDAYSKLDLHWASYNALVSATNIFANIWFTTGKLHLKFIKGVEEILKNEVIIGRVPVLLCWYELYLVLQRYFQQETNNIESEYIPTEHMTDACLSIRLLNLNFKDFDKLKNLPDIFKNNELWLSEDAALYLLGNENLIELDETKTSLRRENFPEYYNKFANQPFVEQIAYDTNFLDGKNVSITSQILGILIEVKFPKNSKLLIIGETILAYLESFLATSFEEAFPLSENININIDFEKINSAFKVTSINKNCFNIHVNNSTELNGANIVKLMDSFLPQVIGGNYIFKDLKQFFDNLYQKDEVHERLSLIVEHYNFLTNILTENPKFFLDDWKTNQTKEYNLLRKESPITIDKELQKLPKQQKDDKPSFKNISHKRIKAETIINTELWDNAKWSGFGWFASEEIPFGIFISFEDGQNGRKIFEEWINKYGKRDVNETVSLTIVKGIDKNNPNWYKVLVSKKVNKDAYTEGNLVSTSSRFHRLEPKDSTNLTRLIKYFETFKRYFLVPAHVDSNFKITPYFELGILKTELKIIDAYQIGIHDLERVVITKEDNPIIPNNVTNAPILEVLKEKRY